jgi:hypothetical protein
MTRRRQNERLRIVVTILVGLIGLAFFAKLQDSDPLLAKLYEFIKDTSLLIATIAVAYLANIYQRRQQFLVSLREQWREIVGAKGALLLYCQTPAPSVEAYLSASAQLSECIDSMRIVYANVGETDKFIGLYPYEPLHDMRRSFEAVDPRLGGSPTAGDRDRIRDEIWDAFNAIREHFLDEFEIEEPSLPIVIRHMKRTRKTGASKATRKLQRQQEVRAKTHATT